MSDILNELFPILFKISLYDSSNEIRIHSLNALAHLWKQIPGSVQGDSPNAPKHLILEAYETCLSDPNQDIRFSVLCCLELVESVLEPPTAVKSVFPLCSPLLLDANDKVRKQAQKTLESLLKGLKSKPVLPKHLRSIPPRQPSPADYSFPRKDLFVGSVPRPAELDNPNSTNNKFFATNKSPNKNSPPVSRKAGSPPQRNVAKMKEEEEEEDWGGDDDWGDEKEETVKKNSSNVTKKEPITSPKLTPATLPPNKSNSSNANTSSSKKTEKEKPKKEKKKLVVEKKVKEELWDDEEDDWDDKEDDWKEKEAKIEEKKSATTNLKETKEEERSEEEEG